MNPEHYTLDELERIAYITGDTERATLYARLSDKESAAVAEAHHDGYREGYDDGLRDGLQEHEDAA